MAKKITAVITAVGHEPYRAYFQEIDGVVRIWTKNSPWTGFKTERHNGGVFCRDWVRALFADHDTSTKVEF